MSTTSFIRFLLFQLNQIKKHKAHFNTQIFDRGEYIIDLSLFLRRICDKIGINKETTIRGNRMKFSKEMYPKVALIKAAYYFTDKAYVHLDADEHYYYVEIESKTPGNNVSEQEFINEMLTQCVRHEVYLQTKSIRELLVARAMATSVIVKDEVINETEPNHKTFVASDILKDWYDNNEDN